MPSKNQPRAAETRWLRVPAITESIAPSGGATHTFPYGIHGAGFLWWTGKHDEQNDEFVVRIGAETGQINSIVSDPDVTVLTTNDVESFFGRDIDSIERSFVGGDRMRELQRGNQQ